MHVWGCITEFCICHMLQKRGRMNPAESERSTLTESLWASYFSCSWFIFLSQLVPFSFEAVFWCVVQVIVEKAEKSDIPDIDKKKSVFNHSRNHSNAFHPTVWKSFLQHWTFCVSEIVLIAILCGWICSSLSCVSWRFSKELNYIPFLINSLQPKENVIIEM
jgi:hypothetical protein